MRRPAKDGKANFVIRGKPEWIKKRKQIDVLLRRALKGGKQAKDKLYKKFSIKVYSSEEVEQYVEEKLKTEVGEELLSEVNAKAMPKRKSR